MKKKIFVCLVIILLFAVIITTLLFINKTNNNTQFYLENDYYTSSDMKEIKIDELNSLINKNESFVVFVYQPMCVTSSDFENVLSEFLKDNQIIIYKIAFSDIKNTNIGKSVKYYPSFLIYNKGKLVDFLEANKDEDVEYYTSKDGFQKWFSKYVKLRDTDSSEVKSSDNESTKEDNNILKNVNLDNIEKEDNKINIYFFWGNGCPHCEEEFKFFESIKEKYGNYYNLYTFETWYNEDNAKLIYTFAEAMDDEVTGVPYTIIGKESFVGFGSSSNKEFIEAIEKQSKNNFDVYFDKIKSN
ncbi:MAG: hypothetical protein ACI4PE_01265 [Bacilli bacterium]